MVVGLVASACVGAPPSPPADSQGVGTGDATTGPPSGSTNSGLDTGSGSASATAVMTSDGDSSGEPSDCSPPLHTPCDAVTDDPLAALGLGCLGELEVMSSTIGSEAAIGIRSGFGQTSTFDPTEGAAYTVLGSGIVAELDSPTPMGDSTNHPMFCNDNLGGRFDIEALPPPLVTNQAGDCTADPDSTGTGDCSGTLGPVFDALEEGVGIRDYTELRFNADVPASVTSLSYDFAFSSTEYPYFAGSTFNDMFIAWLESEQWTGNISFDALGNPISVNASVLTITDDEGDLPELAGTCMRQHGMTGWLTSTAAVTPGETVTVVFAIFDLTDSILDSFVFLDNVRWGCTATDAPFTTATG